VTCDVCRVTCDLEIVILFAVTESITVTERNEAGQGRRSVEIGPKEDTTKPLVPLQHIAMPTNTILTAHPLQCPVLTALHHALHGAIPGDLHIFFTEIRLQTHNFVLNLNAASRHFSRKRISRASLLLFSNSKTSISAPFNSRLKSAFRTIGQG
jgi:hypothetical protein